MEKKECKKIDKKESKKECKKESKNDSKKTDKKKPKKKSFITLIKQPECVVDTLYDKKVNFIIKKIKEQNTMIDDKIRFGWN
jgi:hypothetical protein